MATRKIGNYELIERIGQGGMGTVFRARQISMDRIVALKVLPPSLAKQPTFIERFLREAHASARLSHPNIVGGIDVGDDGGIYYFAMEFVEGSSANKLIREGGLPEEQVLKIGRDIADALAHAHKQGILHRDIKPDNILIDKHGTPKLCDLGLARVESETDEQKSLTQDGTAVGTPHYISPEQARGRHDLDVRTDLYSLGATLYHLLTGKPMFDGPTTAVIMTKHLTGKCINPSDAGVNASKSFVAVLAKLLAKDRADRYESAETLVEDLDRLLQGNSPRHAALAEAKWPFSGGAPGLQPRKAGAAGHIAPPDKTRASQRQHRAASPAGSAKWLVLVGAAVAVAAVLAFAFSGNSSKPAEAAPTAAMQAPAQPATAETAGAKSEAAPRVAEFESKAKDASVENGKRRDDAEAAATRIAAESAALAGQNKFDSAIAVWQKAAAEQSGLLGPRATRAATELRLQAEAKLKGPIDEAVKDLSEKRWSEGMKALDAARGIEFGGWSPRINDLRAKLAAGEQADAEAAKNAVQSVTESALAKHMSAFVAATLKSDIKAARKAAADARADSSLSELAAKVQDMSDVCAALEKAESAKVAALESLKDGKERSFETTRGTLKGVVLKVTPVEITVEFREGAVAGARPVRIADLKDAERKRLAGDFKPVSAAEHLALGIRALASDDSAAAGVEMAEARDFSLAPYYQARLDEKLLGAVEGSAKAAWESLDRATGSGKISEQKSKDISDRIAAFEKEHGKTKFAESIADKLAALQARLGSQAQQMSLDLGGGVKLELVLINPGKFLMGSPATDPKRSENETQHQVVLTRPYYMGKYPVTQEQFEVLMGKNPSTTKGSKNPVDLVSWNDAQDFCARLSQKTNRTVKLPTEAEWEYACRAGSTTEYYFGDNEASLGDYCWFRDNSDDKPGEKKSFAGKMTRPVGGKKPNAWGLYDMHGNVCQWCQDWFAKYSDQPAEDPQGPPQELSNKAHVLRGGSSNLAAQDCRSAFRISYPPFRVSGHVGGFGFRVMALKN